MSANPDDLVDVSRRRLLLGAAAASLCALAPPGLAGTASFWDYPRRLSLHRVATGESASLVYFHAGRLHEAGYRQACHLLRDVRGKQTVAMDPRLLDLLCAIQSWVGAHGYRQPMQILSGYRSPKTNANTEGAARNSMHVQGKAADFRIPGLPVSYLGELAKRYSGGGVGFYYNSNFVHVDTGRVRSWKA